MKTMEISTWRDSKMTDVLGGIAGGGEWPTSAMFYQLSQPVHMRQAGAKLDI